MNEETANLIAERGGSFVRHIANAWLVADSTNRMKLETAFADLFERYAAMIEFGAEA